jgi:hypothetical protein
MNGTAFAPSTDSVRSGPSTRSAWWAVGLTPVVAALMTVVALVLGGGDPQAGGGRHLIGGLILGIGALAAPTIAVVLARRAQRAGAPHATAAVATSVGLLVLLLIWLPLGVLNALPSVVTLALVVSVLAWSEWRIRPRVPANAEGVDVHQPPTSERTSGEAPVSWLTRAWVALATFPVFLLVSVLATLAMYGLFGYKPENADAPVVVALVCTLVGTAVALIPFVTGFLLARRAVAQGDQRGRVPAVLAALLGVAIFVISIVSAVLG